MTSTSGFTLLDGNKPNELTVVSLLHRQTYSALRMQKRAFGLTADYGVLTERNRLIVTRDYPTELQRVGLALQDIRIRLGLAIELKTAATSDSGYTIVFQAKRSDTGEPVIWLTNFMKIDDRRPGMPSFVVLDADAGVGTVAPTAPKA